MGVSLMDQDVTVNACAHELCVRNEGQEGKRGEGA